MQSNSNLVIKVLKHSNIIGFRTQIINTAEIPTFKAVFMPLDKVGSPVLPHLAAYHLFCEVSDYAASRRHRSLSQLVDLIN